MGEYGKGGIVLRKDGRFMGHIQYNWFRFYVYGKTEDEAKQKINSIKNRIDSGETPESIKLSAVDNRINKKTAFTDSKRKLVSRYRHLKLIRVHNDLSVLPEVGITVTKLMDYLMLSREHTKALLQNNTIQSYKYKDRRYVMKKDIENLI